MAVDDPIEFSHLPLILCGPILRRVESHLVSVFVALKEPCQVEIVIYDTPDPASGELHSHTTLGFEPQATLPLGKHLHVVTAVLTIDSAAATLQGLVAGKLYGYDLRLRRAPGTEPETLFSLLSGDYPLGFTTGRLPGFVLPPLDLDAANLFHGSCRKPHGEGHDMLAALDDLIGPDPDDLSRRPHLLLLTGDQIYADDVALPLLRTLNETARQVLGWRERFAGTGLSTPALDESMAGARARCDELDALLAMIEPLPATTQVALDPGALAALTGGLDELPGLLARVRECLPDLPITDLRSIPQILMLAVVSRQLDTYREEIGTQRGRLPPAGASAGVETGVLTNIGFLIDGLRAFLENLAAVVGELVSDASWGRVDDNPATAVDDSVSTAMKLAAGWNYRLSRIAPPQRAAEIKEYARLSSDAMDGHLLFLGEFYMMYLFTWSDVLWRAETGGPLGARLATFKEAVPNYGLAGAYRQRILDQQRDSLLAFAETLPRVRRVLANVPTLMIFDDHEVTDDWNLNYDWVALVNASQAGPQFLRNALAAYAVFQDWGNHPEDYAPGTSGYAILEAIRMQADAFGDLAPPAIVDPSTGGAVPILDEILSIGAFSRSPALDRCKRWSYTYSPHPHDSRQPFQVVVLDTRTRRAFPDEGATAAFISDLKLLLREIFEPNPGIGRVAPAALLSTSAIEEQLARTLRAGMTNIVVSPAPVFGVPLLEDALQRVAVARDNPEIADNEAWQAHPAALLRLLDSLTGKDVVLLSGDVHYAFSNDIFFKEGGRIVQLCASSLKNETDGTRALGQLGHLGTFQELFATFTDPQQLGALVNLFGDNARAYEEEALIYGGAGFWGRKRLPTEGTAGGTSDVWWAETASIFDPITHYLRLKDLSLFSLPHVIPTGLRVVGAGISSFGDLFTAARGNGVFAEERFTVYFLRDDTITDSPDIVGYNNIGQIRFLADPDRLTHTLHWYIHEGNGPPTRDLLATIHETHVRWWYVKRALARLAATELSRWRDAAGEPIRETLPGGGHDPRAEALLNLYYRNAALGQPAWLPGDELIWSAAFISFLVTRAGGAALFRRSAAHIDYIREAYVNRQSSRDNPFWLYDVSEYAPEVGDIVCKDRAAAGELAVTFANLMDDDPALPDGFRKTHCDVVVRVERDQRRLTTIGGNLDDTVAEATVATDDEGRIVTPGYFAVLKVRTDAPAGEMP